jgi:NAD+ diphosphatase
VESALRREVREEVGLELGPLAFLSSHPNRYPYRDVTYATVDLFFVAEAVDPARARPLDAVAGLEWTDPGAVDLDEIAFESMRAALQRYRSGAPWGWLPVVTG